MNQTISTSSLRTWQTHLRNAVRDVETLSQRLGFEFVPQNWDRNPDFPLLVPQPYLDRMNKRDELDPLLLQVVPLQEEHEKHSGWINDPLGERDVAVSSGLLQKYAGRVLVITASACAVNCRYCFRRHFPYDDHRNSLTDNDLDRIKWDQSISEVILSGGEPLLLSDEKLADLIHRLDDISHIKRVRIHTRLPVVIPHRVTSSLIEALATSNKKVVVVLHFNHANEIDHTVEFAMAKLQTANVTLLNQSVLLRGVNDNHQTLVELSEALFEVGILPYYLHMPDHVQGTAHFDVTQTTATRIHRELQGHLPGYLVPRLVREKPGFPSKELVLN